MTDGPSDPLPQPNPWSHPWTVRQLPARKPLRFDLVPDAGARVRIAAALGLVELTALRMVGELRPEGRNDVVLEARLTARAVQPCSVTLAPVPARIDEPVRRRYVADMELPTADEVELSEDVDTEPLPEVIDGGAVALEALVLALPLYPRAPGAGLGEAVFAPPGAVPLRDDDLRPFAGLAALKDRLAGPGPEDDGSPGEGAA
jgi:uncharacterized metal-binding protein YceD (DUF177 family)